MPAKASCQAMHSSGLRPASLASQLLQGFVWFLGLSMLMQPTSANSPRHHPGNATSVGAGLPAKGPCQAIHLSGLRPASLASQLLQGFMWFLGLSMLMQPTSANPPRHHAGNATSVGAGLPAKASCQAIYLSGLRPASLASQLLQGFTLISRKAIAPGGAAGLQTRLGTASVPGQVRLRLPSAIFKDARSSAGTG